MAAKEEALLEELMELEDKVAKKRATKPEELKTEWIKKQRTLVEEDAHALIQVCQYSLASLSKYIFRILLKMWSPNWFTRRKKSRKSSKNWNRSSELGKQKSPTKTFNWQKRFEYFQFYIFYI